jgi:hypothetical protein
VSANSRSLLVRTSPAAIAGPASAGAGAASTGGAPGALPYTVFVVVVQIGTVSHVGTLTRPDCANTGSHVEANHGLLQKNGCDTTTGWAHQFHTTVGDAHTSGRPHHPHHGEHHGFHHHQQGEWQPQKLPHDVKQEEPHPKPNPMLMNTDEWLWSW